MTENEKQNEHDGDTTGDSPDRPRELDVPKPPDSPSRKPPVEDPRPERPRVRDPRVPRRPRKKWVG